MPLPEQRQARASTPGVCPPAQSADLLCVLQKNPCYRALHRKEGVARGYNHM